MPRQRWREQVLEELRGSRADIRALHDEVRGSRSDIRSLGDRQELSLRDLRDANERMLRRFAAEHRDVARDMKASVDRNTEVTHRCADVLSGLVAQVASHESRVDDMVEQIGAQTSALLTLIDEIRGQNGSRGGPTG